MHSHRLSIKRFSLLLILTTSITTIFFFSTFTQARVDPYSNEKRDAEKKAELLRKKNQAQQRREKFSSSSSSSKKREKHLKLDKDAEKMEKRRILEKTRQFVESTRAHEQQQISSDDATNIGGEKKYPIASYRNNEAGDDQVVAAFDDEYNDLATEEGSATFSALTKSSIVKSLSASFTRFDVSSKDELRKKIEECNKKFPNCEAECEKIGFALGQRAIGNGMAFLELEKEKENSMTNRIEYNSQNNNNNADDSTSTNHHAGVPTTLVKDALDELMRQGSEMRNDNIGSIHQKLTDSHHSLPNSFSKFVSRYLFTSWDETKKLVVFCLTDGARYAIYGISSIVIAFKMYKYLYVRVRVLGRSSATSSTLSSLFTTFYVAEKMSILENNNKRSQLRRLLFYAYGLPVITLVLAISSVSYQFSIYYSIHPQKPKEIETHVKSFTELVVAEKKDLYNKRFLDYSPSFEDKFAHVEANEKREEEKQLKALEDMTMFSMMGKVYSASTALVTGNGNNDNHDDDEKVEDNNNKKKNKNEGESSSDTSNWGVIWDTVTSFCSMTFSWMRWFFDLDAMYGLAKLLLNFAVSFCVFYYCIFSWFCGNQDNNQLAIDEYLESEEETQRVIDE